MDHLHTHNCFPIGSNCTQKQTFQNIMQMVVGGAISLYIHSGEFNMLFPHVYIVLLILVIININTLIFRENHLFAWKKFSSAKSKRLCVKLNEKILIKYSFFSLTTSTYCNKHEYVIMCCKLNDFTEEIPISTLWLLLDIKKVLKHIRMQRKSR